MNDKSKSLDEHPYSEFEIDKHYERLNRENEMAPENSTVLTAKIILTILTILLFYALFTALDWAMGIGDAHHYKVSASIFVGLLVAHEWFSAGDE